MCLSALDIVAVMISVPGRAEVRARTIEQLLPLQPMVFAQEDMPLGKTNHCANVAAALTWALAQDMEYILFLEDDLDISTHFDAAVNTAYESGRPIVSFYAPGMRFYPAAARRQIERGQYEPGLYRPISRAAWFGSQALLLRRDAAETCATQYQDMWFDLRLQKLTQFDMAIYVPNPVQHYGGRLKSTWSGDGKPHMSRSYQP